MKTTHIITSIAAAALFAAGPAFAHEGEKGDGKSKEITVTGEVIDMVCYLDHEGAGEKHADCAQKCIKMGLPVGIKADNGHTYLLVGEHAPMNDTLAPLAAKTITVKGKAVERDGFHMIENVEIVKQ